MAAVLEEEDIKAEPGLTPAKEIIKSEIISEVKGELKGEDKNKSRSGRVIKRTKYLHDEFEEVPPVQVKRKRLSEGQAPVSKMKKVNGNFPTEQQREIITKNYYIVTD